MAEKPKLKKRKFNPEGAGYDITSAIKSGAKPDKTGHMPSRDPVSGLLFKGKKHETFHKTVAAETKLGYEIYKGKDKRYYSRKKK